ncbi:hypothetical protein ACH4FX_35985 [Streptomyces sp. NPDC018019]|uniref:hypothetical protein n=1 Tax=Streptomyces sp. NPDC018019 TaxID=3365030 RepID=UPI0037B4C0EA
MAEGTPDISNDASGITAGSVVQVGVLHGGLTIHSGPRRSDEALLVSVTTSRIDSTTYHYEGRREHPVRKVHLFVEAFTPQAVILHRLRPIVVRQIPEYTVSRAALAYRRKFAVDLDLPATNYTADLARQDLHPNQARPIGEADFPFYVTASDPEYFVIKPTAFAVTEWRLELDWSCLGQHGTVTIDRGSNRPFVR